MKWVFFGGEGGGGGRGFSLRNFWDFVCLGRDFLRGRGFFVVNFEGTRDACCVVRGTWFGGWCSD